MPPHRPGDRRKYDITFDVLFDDAKRLFVVKRQSVETAEAAQTQRRALELAIKLAEREAASGRSVRVRAMNFDRLVARWTSLG